MIAITQPTFAPWIGWFDIASQCDLVVLLDDAQFVRRSWHHRNQLRIVPGLKTVTVPVLKTASRETMINEAQLADPDFAVYLQKFLQKNYGNASFFSSFYPELEEVLLKGVQTHKLARLNIGIIELLRSWLSIDTAFYLSSSLGLKELGSHKLAQICALMGQDQYLSTIGALDYLIHDKDVFEKAGIKVYIHNFSHPTYPQVFPGFFPNASALDLVMNCGRGARRIMDVNRRPAVALGEYSLGGRH